MGLSQVLADTYVLYCKTHGFHWTMTGPMFTSLPALLMEQYIASLQNAGRSGKSDPLHEPGSHPLFWCY